MAHSEIDGLSAKKRLNVDSPSFTPSSLTPNGNRPATKTPGLSPKMANAAPFKPRNIPPTPNTNSTSVSSVKSFNPNARDWISPDAQEFVPQAYHANDQEYSQTNAYDIYSSTAPSAPSSNTSEIQNNTSLFNTETNGFSQAYYSGTPSHSQFLHHHLYAPLDAQFRLAKPNQRTSRDVFVSEELRRKLQAKNDAFIKTFSHSALPQHVEYFYALTPLRGTSPSTQSFHHERTVYKAISRQDGKTYCIKRIHNYEVTKEEDHAIRAISPRWSAVKNSSVVSVHMAFSTTAFGDSSLILISDYHPASNSVAEQPSREGFPRTNRNPHSQKQYESFESTMWSYVVQIANGLRSVHSQNLAARNVNIHKVLVTDENRIRLGGCAIKDILDKDIRSISELQQEDLKQFGLFMLAAAARHIGQAGSRSRGLDIFNASDPRLKSAVEWLLDRSRPTNERTIDAFLGFISAEITNTFDAALRFDDEIQASFARELENARIVRLMTKLQCLLERPEHEHDRSWTMSGPRGVISLFRDYVFHQVDSQSLPVLDMGHILGCLNKLDAGFEEKVQLVTRDEQSIIVLSYKEIKAEIERAWQQLVGRASS